MVSNLKQDSQPFDFKSVCIGCKCRHAKLILLLILQYMIISICYRFINKLNDVRLFLKEACISALFRNDGCFISNIFYYMVNF
mmetsp:Transcript_44153/g.44681  ORF Transcript_44153/g.44681 Transcript_44153/m.44681 type:complete len:83 (-) Transcript_44153:97-345(-)